MKIRVATWATLAIGVSFSFLQVAQAKPGNTHPVRIQSPEGRAEGIAQSQGSRRAVNDLRQQLNLSQDEDLAVTRMKEDRDGIGHSRLQQTVHGLSVFGAQVVTQEQDGEIQSINGNLLQGIDPRNLSSSPSVSSSAALQNALTHFADGATFTYTLQSNELVYFPFLDNVFLAYHIIFKTEKQAASKPGIWNYFVAAERDGRVIHFFNSSDTLSQASGPGGNPIHTNAWTDALDVENGATAGTYVMDTSQLRTVTMSNGTSGNGTIISGPLNPIGDAAVNDAHGYAEVVLNMLQNWFGYNSIDNAGFKIISRAHYSTNYDNAFWNGSVMTYGDGGTYFYPLSTGVDVVSHEIAHGFTQFHSALIYDNESGGMNESFSDIAGNTAEFFFDPARADFDIGEDIVKPAFGKSALRFMCSPTTDGISIENYANYNDNIDVHHSSGIMNKAFCRYARRISSNGDPAGAGTQAGVQRAAKVFYEANDNYWVSSSSFTQGCQGTVDAAVALGHSETEVSWLAQSWADVGVFCNPDFYLSAVSSVVLSPGGSANVTVTVNRPHGYSPDVDLSVTGLPAAISGSISPNPAGSSATLSLSASALASGTYNVKITATKDWRVHRINLRVTVVTSLANNSPVTISEGLGSWRYFKIAVPFAVSQLRVTQSSGTGDADLYVKRGSPPTSTDYDCRPWLGGNAEECMFTNPLAGDWYIGVYGYATYANVNLVGVYTLVPPAAPSNLAATTISTSQINLAWSDNANTEDGFKIERKTGAAGSWSEIAQVGANTTTYSNSGLPANTEYYYRVRAHREGSTLSAYSNEARGVTQFVPNSPKSLSATTTSATSIVLNWVDDSNNEANFEIDRKVAGGSYSVIASPGANSTSYTSTVVANTQYVFRIRAKNIAGYSSYSNEASANTLPPAAPSGLVALARSTSRIDITWLDNSNNETSFLLQRSVNGGAYANLVTLGANATSYSHTGLTAGNTYNYRVRSQNTVGVSAWSNIEGASTKIPPKPTSVVAKGTSSSQVKITWVDNGGESSFRIYRSTSATGGFAQIGTAAKNAVSYLDNTVSAGTPYYYYVRAFNDSIGSANSNIDGTLVLIAPNSLTATAVSSSRINLAWAYSGAGQAGFKIERKTATGAWTQIATVLASVRSYASTGLAAHTQYSYRVRANNIESNSSYSNTATATTN